MAEVLPDRMRIRRGRVMHRVKQRGDWIESQCRSDSGIKGVSTTYPRVQGYADDWTTERHWYPDCRQCPPDPTAEKGATT